MDVKLLRTPYRVCQTSGCPQAFDDLSAAVRIPLFGQCIHVSCYLQGGLRLTPAAFFCNWFATVLVTLVAQSLGLLIGATVMNAKTAQTVTAVIMLTMMLGGHLPCLLITCSLHDC